MKYNKLTKINVLNLVSVILLLSCGNEEQAKAPDIERISFKEAKVELSVGQRKSIEVNVEPKEAGKSGKIEYVPSAKGIIEVNEEASSNEGVVITAIAPGSVVLTGRYGGIVDYCQINVSGGNEITIPYITVTDSVLEIPVGKKKHTVVSLQGGNPSDRGNFTFSNSNDNVLFMDAVNNTVVLEGLKKGISTITVGHPKAQYGVDIPVFIYNEGETARYITGESVVFMDLGEGTKEYASRLVGVQDGSINNTVYQVVEGYDIADVMGVGASCTIKAKKPGLAKIKVSNQAVEYPFEFLVVVRHESELRYIKTKNNFYIINDTDNIRLNASFEGDVPYDWADKFSYSVKEEEKDILEINHVMDLFIVKGIKNGKAVLTITNEYGDFPCEILFIVNNNNEYNDFLNDGLYIRTSQNVIQMEAGKNAPDAVLKMELVGGTGADQGNFEWIVEDSSVIDVKAPGTVTNRRAQANIQNALEVEAVITAKKTGTTRITVTNKKALNEVNVIVKVYPYGTFNGQAVYLGGQSVIKVKEGTEKDVFVSILGGDGKNLGITEWECDNGSIAEAYGSGLTGVVRGKSNASGITTIRVKGQNIAREYEAVVVVYREGEEDVIPYIYADNLRYNLTVGQSVSVPIRHPNIPAAGLNIGVQNYNNENIHYIIKNDVLIIYGVAPGTCELFIRNQGISCNDLTVFIAVEEYALDIEHPYYLTGENIVGIKAGSVLTYKAGMIGATNELKNMLFSIDDTDVAQIAGISANEVQIKGIKEGQTVLRINHSRSVNEKTVVIYVVGENQAIEGKIIIGIGKQNYTLIAGESVFLKLSTNAGDEDKKLFKYTVSGSENIHVDFNYDRIVVTGLLEGNSKITVSCYNTNPSDRKNLVDLDIFFTIKQDNYGIKGEIGFPDGVVLVKGQFKILKGSAVGVTVTNYNDIEYELEDSSIANVTGNGLEATMKGLKSGQTFMVVSYRRLNFFKKVLVICVESETDLEKLYYFTVPKTIYRIQKGENIKINLSFGENGAPGDGIFEWNNINGNEAVAISTGNMGKNAVITGKNEGRAVVRITCDAIPDNKNAEIIIEVSEKIQGSGSYRFGYSSGIEQIKAGEMGFIPVSIYYGNQYYDEFDVFNPGIKMETGYSGINVEVSDRSVIDAAMGGENGQILRISAKKAGKSEIILSHDMIEKDAKILIIVYEGNNPPDAGAFYFFAYQKYYLIDKGGEKIIALQSNKDAAYCRQELLCINKNPDIFTTDSSDIMNIRVTGVQPGSGIIEVTDTRGFTETVYISVSENIPGSNVTVATESIIILSLESDYSGYNTRIIANGGNAYGITWEAENKNIIRYDSFDRTCVLYPIAAGITELKVGNGSFEKNIIVKVVETDEQRQAVKLINLDQRYYKMKKGETIIISPYYKFSKPLSPVRARSVNNNKIVSWEPGGSLVTGGIYGGLAVTAKNIGIDYLIISNGCENETRLTFEVDENVTGGTSQAKDVVYMVTENPVIIMEPNTAGYYVEIGVIGQYAGASGDFVWTSDTEKIRIKSFGTYAFITTDHGEFKGIITIKNNYCTEQLTINIIVNEKFVKTETKEPYIYTSQNVYKMNKTDSSLLIPVEIMNVDNVNYNNIVLTNSGEHVFSCTYANGNIIVNSKDTGSGRIDVLYGGLKTSIYIIIQEVSENGAIFLTTSQNYTIVNVNNTKAVNVTLANYEEPDSTKFSWKSDNNGVAQIVGSGRSVQVLGIGIGITKITVSHEKSFNDLEIIVKVIASGTSEEICYLTTNDNIIETYVSTGSIQISVNKIGGKTGGVDAVWSVDNPAVVGVVGTNDRAYITAKKAGIAKITVSDKEANSVGIVVIVREAKPGDLFIIPDQNIVQIVPGSTNGVIGVFMEGIQESEQKDFNWEIYSQMPSDIDVARNGGNVINIFGMGNRASVNGIYAGTARIRITHPKAAQAAYIIVQVTNFRSMSFTQTSVDIIKNDISYVVLETPDYENNGDKMEFISDNPGVATVIGTSKVALISAHAPGKAVITASIKNTSLQASVSITVHDTEQFGEPDILVNRTMYILNPRETPFYINARILGFGITENDDDYLEWKLNYTDEEKKKPLIKIYPENVAVDKGFRSVGKNILVEVQNIPGKSYGTAEYCTLTISHKYTSRKRILYFQIQEESGSFTLNKRSIQLQAGDSVELSCNIINGTSRDYDEVVWEARKDSIDPGKDIVRVIGRGQTVRLLGMTDGETIVSASYRGLNSAGTTCFVSVKSVYYFNITYQQVLAYPGQKDNDGKGLFSIAYSIRPPSAMPVWLNSDTDRKIATVIDEGAKDDGSGTGRGRLLLEFHQEGGFTIMGTHHSISSKVDIVVKNIFSFQIISNQMVSGTPYTNNESGINANGTYIKDKGYQIEYSVIPSNAQIRIVPGTSQSNFNSYSSDVEYRDKGFDIIIEPPVANGLRGYGNIFIKNGKEDNLKITFALHKPSGEQVLPPQERTVYLQSRFPWGYGRLIPVFEKIGGRHSNETSRNRGNVSYPNTDGTVYANQIKPLSTSLTSGEYLRGKSVSSSEITSSDGIIDTYEIEIGDGEEHYIILDTAHKDATATVVSTAGLPVIDTENGRGLTASLVKLDNGISADSLTAVKISGGKDFIVYDSFGTNFSFTADVSSFKKHEDTDNVLRTNYVKVPVGRVSDRINNFGTTYSAIPFIKTKSIRWMATDRTVPYIIEFVANINDVTYDDYTNYSSSGIVNPNPTNLLTQDLTRLAYTINIGLSYYLYEPNTYIKLKNGEFFRINDYMINTELYAVYKESGGGYVIAGFPKSCNSQFGVNDFSIYSSEGSFPTGKFYIIQNITANNGITSSTGSTTVYNRNTGYNGTGTGIWDTIPYQNYYWYPKGGYFLVNGTYIKLSSNYISQNLYDCYVKENTHFGGIADTKWDILHNTFDYKNESDRMTTKSPLNIEYKTTYLGYEGYATEDKAKFNYLNFSYTEQGIKKYIKAPVNNTAKISDNLAVVISRNDRGIPPNMPPSVIAKISPGYEFNNIFTHLRQLYYESERGEDGFFREKSDYIRIFCNRLFHCYIDDFTVLRYSLEATLPDGDMMIYPGTNQGHVEVYNVDPTYYSEFFGRSYLSSFVFREDEFGDHIKINNIKYTALPNNQYNVYKSRNLLDFPFYSDKMPLISVYNDTRYFPVAYFNDPKQTSETTVLPVKSKIYTITINYKNRYNNLTNRLILNVTHNVYPDKSITNRIPGNYVIKDDTQWSQTRINKGLYKQVVTDNSSKSGEDGWIRNRLVNILGNSTSYENTSKSIRIPKDYFTSSDGAYFP